MDITDQWRGRLARPVEVTVRDTPSGRVGANFTALLRDSRVDFAFLADHDDIWLCEKIEQGWICIPELQSRVGALVPLLVHGDLSR